MLKQTVSTTYPATSPTSESTRAAPSPSLEEESVEGVMSPGSIEYHPRLHIERRHQSDEFVAILNSRTPRNSATPR